MRANKIVNYESILQVLGEAGCPFCRFMKNFQAALLQDPTEKDIEELIRLRGGYQLIRRSGECRFT